MISIGQQIKSGRISAGLTQEQLGEQIGFTKQEVSRWESDKHTPRFCTISKIQKVLNIIIEMP
jgi:transcriptional regulator with XRE-family HTH domain